MARFAINPPNSPLTDGGGYVTAPWYRWFARVQDVLGDDLVAAIAAAPVLTYSATTAFSADKILTAGAGIGLTSAATTLTVALTATGVTAAAYGSASEVPSFTVDQYGRLTLAANVTITPAAIGAASSSLTLTAGAGLTGGGDLTVNRTFDVGAGTGITVNANDVALDTTNTRNVDHASVTFTAGAGLTGGGTLEASRTFDIGAGTGITVNANDVALDTTSTRNTDHASVTLTAGDGLTGGGDISASRSFAVGAGTGISVSADAVAIADTAVTPGSYTRANITVDQQGRLTAAASGSADAVSSVFGRTGAVVAATSDYDAVQVDNTPAGNIAATNVQAAIDELDTEKVAKAGDTMTGALTISLATGNSLIVDTNVLVVDATNNRVGIGDASPDYKLDVIDTSVTTSGTVAAFGDNNIADGLQLLSDSSGLTWGFNALNSRALSLRTNQTERLGISSTGFCSVTGSFGRGAPVTKTANFSVGTAENWLINNKAGSSCTVTLPSASTYTGREIMILNYQAQTVVSASSNVVPITGGAAGTAILAATAGLWAILVSDGTNWLIMATG